MRVVGNALPFRLKLTPRNRRDAPIAEILLKDLQKGVKFLADKAYDANWIRQLIDEQDRKAHIPKKSKSIEEIYNVKTLYKRRNLIDGCINKVM